VLDGASPTSSPVAPVLPSPSPVDEAPVANLVVVPDLAGKSISQALVLLSGANLLGNFVMSNGTPLPANTSALIVVSQNPVVSSVVTPGSTVLISVQ
jgi:hypothetical protein